MTFEIELFIPSALPGAGAQTDSLGACRVITRNVFVTITEVSGDANLILLDEVLELDRTQPRLTTVLGRTTYPRRIDFPDRIFVETATGHARAISGDQIARVTAVQRSGPKGPVRW